MDVLAFNGPTALSDGPLGSRSLGKYKRTLARSLTILNGYANGKRRKVKPRSSEREQPSLRQSAPPARLKMHGALR